MDDRNAAVGGLIPMGRVVFGQREQVIYPDGRVMCHHSVTFTRYAPPSPTGEPKPYRGYGQTEES